MEQWGRDTDLFRTVHGTSLWESKTPSDEVKNSVTESEYHDEEEDEDETMIYKEDKSFFDTISSQYMDLLIGAKRCIYEEIVISPSADSKEGQSIERLEDYKKRLHELYRHLFRNNGAKNTHPRTFLRQFTPSTQQQLIALFEWIYSFFSTEENRSKTVSTPYYYYTYCQLRMNEFNQTPYTRCYRSPDVFFSDTGELIYSKNR